MSAVEETDIQEGISASIRKAGTLVKFSSTMWAGTKEDWAAVQAVRVDKNASGDIGKFRKNLMANNDKELNMLRSAINGARNTYYRLTLPFSINRGPRLMANIMFQEFITEMGECKTRIGDAKEEFVKQYPVRVQASIASLGDMADPSLYPPATAIADRFGIAFEFWPVPVSDDYSMLPKGIMSSIQRHTESRVRESIEAAQKSGWEKLALYLENMASKLNDPEAVFRDSLVSNISRVIRIMEAFNITGNSEIGDLLTNAATHLTSHDAKELRNNATLRKDVATEADDILARVRAITGG